MMTVEELVQERVGVAADAVGVETRILNGEGVPRLTQQQALLVEIEMFARESTVFHLAFDAGFILGMKHLDETRGEEKTAELAREFEEAHREAK